MGVSQNDQSDNISMEYWSSARVKKLSTNSKWMDQVYLDSTTLIELASEEGTSDSLRLNYTIRAIEALEEICEFLKEPKEE